MGLSFFWRLEGTTLDGTHDFVASGADGSATANAGASLDAAAARIGSTGGLYSASSSDQHRFDIAAELIDRLVGSIALSVRMDTAPTGFQAILALYGADGNFVIELGADEVRASVNLEGTGETQLTTDGASLVEDEWYGIVFRWDHANDLRRIEVYDDTDTLITFAESTAAWTAPANLVNSSGFRLGNVSGTDSLVHIDNVFIADAYDEPLEDNFQITSYTEYDAGGITSATLDFTGANGFFDENGDPVDASGLTLYIWRAPRPPSSVGTPDQIITSVDVVDGELSQAINLGSLEENDTVFGVLFGADGTDLYWAGEVTPVYG